LREGFAMNPESLPQPQPADISLRSILGAVFLFLGGFVATAALLHLAVGDTMALYASGRSEKLEILKRNHYAYSTAIFGTSHVQQGFDPRAFDATLAGTPIAVRSFNLGLDGGAQVEQRLMAQDFLRHLTPPAGGGPCIVMLEVNADPTFAMNYTSHPRQINILDWSSLRLSFDFPTPGFTGLYKLHRRLMNVIAAFYHTINMGMLSNRIFRPPFNEASIDMEMANDQRGMHHVPPNAIAEADIARIYKKQHFPPTPVPSDMPNGYAELIEGLHRAPHGDRVQFAWVEMPWLRDLASYEVYPTSQKTSFGEVPILDLGRPDLYPELYNRSLWEDSQHMNEEGSKLFSRLLANQLLAWTRDHPARRCGG
jgi:hypothetical protein